MQRPVRAQRYTLFLWTLNQSAGIAGRKARITASGDAVCVDGMVGNRMRIGSQWRRVARGEEARHRTDHRHQGSGESARLSRWRGASLLAEYSNFRPNGAPGCPERLSKVAHARSVADGLEAYTTCTAVNIRPPCPISQKCRSGTLTALAIRACSTLVARAPS